MPALSPMTLELAKAIDQWFERASRMTYSEPHAPGVYFVAFTHATASVRTYVASVYGDQIFVITPRGVGMLMKLAEPIGHMAAECIKRHRAASHKTVDEDERVDANDGDGDDDDDHRSDGFEMVSPFAKFRNRPAKSRDDLPKPAPVSAPAPAPMRFRRSMCWSLYDPAVLARRIADAKPGGDRLQTLNALRARPERRLPAVSAVVLENLNRLRIDFPNFMEVIEQIETDLLFARYVRSPISFAPILLLGPPGVGKTEFMRRLSESLSMHYEFQSAAEATTGWILTGADAQWKDSKPGLLSRAIIGLPDGKGLMIGVDELDKAARGGISPFDLTLLGLLEPGTARAFKDEFLDLPLDTTPVCWMLTANHREVLRPELLSRVREFVIPSPTQAQMPAVVRSIDRGMRRHRPAIDKCFAPLGQDVIETTQQITPREISKQLLNAYGIAVREATRAGMRSGRTKKLQLKVDHVRAAYRKPPAEKAAIGFVS